LATDITPTFAVRETRLPKTRPRIALVFEGMAPWIELDRELMGDLATIRLAQLKVKENSRLLRSFFAYLGAIVRSDIIVAWFTANPAVVLSFFLAKILNKKFINIAGANDISRDEAVRSSWGSFSVRSKLYFPFTRFILARADCVVCVSNFVREEILSYVRPRAIEVVPLGVDTAAFTGGGGGDEVLMVAVGMAYMKGLERFIRLAESLPSRKFVIVGGVSRIFERTSGLPNLEIVGQIPHAEMIYWYRRARFYCQPSRYETFGLATAEAMACGCVPIVSDAGALPEVAGNVGFVIPDGDPRLAKEVIENEWANYRTFGEMARQRIENNYSLDIRGRKLKQVLQSLR
jgi:glycosyltransferase involved in cell wall biosynthesis